MAKFLSGIGFGQASGSVAGTTYSRNRNGTYMRNRAMPANPASSKQGVVRSRFGSLSQSWRGLTPSQRTTWNSQAATRVLIDSLGQQYNPTGLQFFVGVNQVRLALGLALATNPPADPGQAVITAGSATVVGATGVVTVNFAPPIGAAAYYELLATSPVSQGRNYFARSQFKTLAYLTNADVSPFAATGVYASVYGSIVPADVAKKLAFQLRPINSAGYQSVPFQFTAIVT
jgi:hypothetical protein